MKKEKKIGKTFYFMFSHLLGEVSRRKIKRGKQFSCHCIESQSKQQMYQNSNGQSFVIALHRMDGFIFTTSEYLKDAFTEIDEVCKDCSDRCHISA